MKIILQDNTSEVVILSSLQNKEWFDENDAVIEGLLQKSQCLVQMAKQPQQPTC